MGADPKARVWYGVAGHDLELSDAAQAREEEDWFREDRPAFRSFYCSDVLMGFGVELLNHDWNDSPERLDFAALEAKAKALAAEADPVLDALGFGPERGVYLLTDYS